MTISVVGSSSVANGSFTTPITLTKPSGLANGDVLFAVLARQINYTTGWSTVPSGWTDLGLAIGSSNDGFSIFRKIITDAANEPASYQWYSSSSAWMVGALVALRDVDTANSIDAVSQYGTAAAFGSASSGTTATAKSVTTTKNKDFLLNIYLHLNSGSNLSVQSQTHIAGDNSYSTGTMDLRLARPSANSGIISPAGATGDYTATSSGSGNWFTTQLAIAEKNTLPSAPTNVVAGGAEAKVQEGDPLPVTWTHNDPDGDAQVKYRLRWRKVLT